MLSALGVNRFTFCTRGNQHLGCILVTVSGILICEISKTFVQYPLFRGEKKKKINTVQKMTRVNTEINFCSGL